MTVSDMPVACCFLSARSSCPPVQSVPPRAVRSLVEHGSTSTLEALPGLGQRCGVTYNSGAVCIPRNYRCTGVSDARFCAAGFECCIPYAPKPVLLPTPVQQAPAPAPTPKPTPSPAPATVPTPLTPSQLACMELCRTQLAAAKDTAAPRCSLSQPCLGSLLSPAQARFLQCTEACLRPPPAKLPVGAGQPCQLNADCRSKRCLTVGKWCL